MCQRSRHRFTDIETTTPQAARRLATTTIRETVSSIPDGVGEDAELIIDELVTNAVHANAQTIELEIDVHRDHIEIVVTDDGIGWPTPQTPSTHATSGRGLQIVAALTGSWGVTRSNDERTSVWAHVPCDPSHTATVSCTRSASRSPAES